MANGDRQRAEQGADGRHHDRPEAEQRGLHDRGLGIRPLPAPFDREVDHHDGVLLHDADQHDHADHGDDRKVHVEEHQRGQRTDAGRRQSREDRQRVDEVFVKDSQDDVDHEDGGKQQQALICHGLLEDLGTALEAGGDGCRQPDLHRRRLDVAHGVTQRNPWREVEGDHHRRKLGDMVDGERGRLVGALGQRVERHQAAVRRSHLQTPQDVAGVAVLRIGLEDHLVGIVRRIDRRHLTGPERRVEEQPDLIDRNAETRGDVAVDVDHRRTGAHLQIRVHVEDRGNAAHPRFHQRRVLAQQIEVARAHAELILGTALRRADVDRLGSLKEHVDTRHGGRRAAQSGDDLLGAVLTLRLVPQHDEDATGIHGRRRIAAADRGNHRGHIGIAPYDFGQRRLARHHGIERRVVGSDSRALDLSDVLRREEALRDRLEQHRRHHEGAEGDGQHQPRQAHRPSQRPSIALRQLRETPLEHPQQRIVLLVVIDRLQPSRAKHWRQGQRHDARDQDGEGDHQAELVEHAADDTAHEENGDEDRNQRQCHRHDREADLPGALERGFHRLFARFDMTDDVLQHDDGIVDHEAHGEGQGQQRYVVDRVAAEIHAGEGADHRNRQGDRRDHGCAEAAQEEIDGDDDQDRRQGQRKLDVGDRLADGLGPVGEQVDFDTGRQFGLDLRDDRLDPIDHFDRVGIGLAIDTHHDGAGPVQPARHLVVLDAVDGRRDIGDADWRPILPGDDHRHVIGCLVDRPRGFEDRILLLIGDRSDWLTRVGVDDRSLQFLHRQAADGELVEIGTNANGELLRAEDQHLRHAREGRDARHDRPIDESVHVRKTRLIRLEGEEHHGPVGRIYLSETGRRRHLGRQTPHRR